MCDVEEAEGHESAALQLLVDRAEIHDVMMRYAAGVDRRDFGLVSSCFAEDLKVVGWGNHNFPDREALIEFISGVAHYDMTMHMMGNQFIEVSGDRADMDTYAMLTHHRIDNEGKPVELNVSGGRYVEKLARQDGSWRIVQRGGEPEWAPTGVTQVTTLDPAVRWLLDRAEIHDVMMHYALGIDLHDYDRIARCFASDFQASYGDRAFTDMDALIAFIQGVERFDSTTHFLGSQLIDLTGDVADVETYALITHRETVDGAPVEWVPGGGRYVDRFVREQGRWRIGRRGAATVGPPRRKAPGPRSVDARTKWLVDRADIHDLIVQSVLAIDRRDTAMLAGCLAPTFRYSVGEETIEDATALGAYVTTRHPNLEGLHHLLGNHLVEVHGDWARAETYVYVTYRRTKDGPLSPWSNGARRLVDALVRHDGRWVIRERTVTTNHTPVVRRKDPPSMT